MACPFNKESIAQLETFITLCRNRPEVLHAADLSFFRDYIESLGGNIPSPSKQTFESMPEPRPPTPEPENIPDVEDSDSELEFDMEGCVPPDVLDDDQQMGDDEKVPTEEECDQADEIKREAIGAMNEGENAKAVELFSRAIQINPKLAILFTKRGQAYLRLDKPNACIKDCTRALELNCDSAPGYKFRGRAYRLIGMWAEAAKDLRQACKIDFDEQADEWLKEVQPNAIKIEQHKIKQERKMADMEVKEKTERMKKAREAHAKAAKESKDEPRPQGMPGGAAGMSDFYSLLQDPEIMAAFKDPEIAAAFSDVTSNPANMSKYQDNPKMQALMNKLATKFDGGLPGFPMGATGTGAASGGTTFTPQDDGLD